MALLAFQTNRNVVKVSAILLAMTVNVDIISAFLHEGTTRIAGYQTKSTVTGSTVDMDQAEMEHYLDEGEFEKAKKVYELGAHQAPHATLKLDEPIKESVEAPSGPNDQRIRVIGMTENGQEAVYGHIHRGLREGQIYVDFDYEITEDQYKNKYIPCAVGGRDEPTMDGCLAMKGGLILDSDHDAVRTLTYEYDPHVDNKFWTSLKGYSTEQAETVFKCKDKCPYPEYEKFFRYYGQMEYGDLWIESAFQGSKTLFAAGAHFTNGNEDFSQLTLQGRAEAIKTATVTMNLFTQVNRIMTEGSIDRCVKQCGRNNPCPEAAGPWDFAVANYAGSLEGSDGTGQGYLYYGLADRLCTEFATCVGSSAETATKHNNILGTSKVNMDVIQQFQLGRTQLEAGNCRDAEYTKFNINQMMTIPLIQGTLLSAYRLHYSTYKTNERDEERGRGAAFAAGILPDIHACAPNDAQIIYDSMSLSNGALPNFDAVKAALERNYECLNIQCEDVGGIFNPKSGTYHEGADPCVQYRQKGFSSAATPRETTINNTSKKNKTNSFLAGKKNYKGPMMFVVCNLVIAIALIVKRNRWIPAISSQIDSIVSRQIGSSSATHHRLSDDSSYPYMSNTDEGNKISQNELGLLSSDHPSVNDFVHPTNNTFVGAHV